MDQAVIGGCAHLLSFSASLNAPAAYYAQTHWNKGKPVAMTMPSAGGDVLRAFARERFVHGVIFFAFGVTDCVLFSC